MKNKLIALVETTAVQRLKESAIKKMAESAAAKKEEAAKKGKGAKGAAVKKVEEISIQLERPPFQVGDQVEIHQRILEGTKERTQVFAGVVIARRGEGMREMFTVRRIVQGEGVERVFPLHSPRIAKIEVKRSGKVRRAKLYYLRKRVGKATRLKERKGKETVAVPSDQPTT